jgi:hypothetical protein
MQLLEINLDWLHKGIPNKSVLTLKKYLHRLHILNLLKYF